MSSNGKTIAIVGATGAVGEVLLQVLEERQFPVDELRPLASERSSGTTVQFHGRDLPVGLARPEAFDDVDFVFFAATGTLSKELAPEAARRGAVAIDKSSTWRMTPISSFVSSLVRMTNHLPGCHSNSTTIASAQRPTI